MTTPQPAAPLPKMNEPEMGYDVGQTITVQLPNEVTRAVIEKAVSPTACLARINTFTTGHISHNYRRGDLIPCRYDILALNQRGWRVVSEREMAEAEEAERRKAEAAVKKTKQKRKRRAPKARV